MGNQGEESHMIERRRWEFQTCVQMAGAGFWAAAMLIDVGGGGRSWWRRQYLAEDKAV